MGVFFCLGRISQRRGTEKKSTALESVCLLAVVGRFFLLRGELAVRAFHIDV